MSSSSDARDIELRAMIGDGAIERATEETLRSYGPELIGWLRSIFSSDADAQDAFSRMSEELWRSLSRYDGRCSLRTWCYMLARHAAAKVRAQPRLEHEVLVSQFPTTLAGAVTHVWNTTRARAQQDADVYAEIRRELDDDDQLLLVLRVDRDLGWRDIAQVMLGEDADADAIQRKAAALRKQFERVKARLRALAADRLGE